MKTSNMASLHRMLAEDLLEHLPDYERAFEGHCEAGYAVRHLGLGAAPASVALTQIHKGPGFCQPHQAHPPALHRSRFTTAQTAPQS